MVLQKPLKNSRVAKEVVCRSQSVGEEIQALFCITVDLRKTLRKLHCFEKELHGAGTFTQHFD